MTQETRNIAFFILISCLCVLAWAVTILGSLFDLRRRNIPSNEQIAWIALIALIPGFGFAGYLLSRLLAASFSPPKMAAPPPKRETQAYRVTDQDIRSGTIPAIELLNPTLADRPASSVRFGTGSTDPRQIITLSAIAGPHTGQTFVLNDLPISIGRETDSVISLPEDLRVSRLHAEIYRKDAALRIRDLRSTHGTFVNGFSIDDKALDLGDKIEVGSSLLLVEID